jgi:GT2 family glycosyltransferase
VTAAGAESAPAKVPDGLGPALDWMSDRLARALLQPPTVVEEEEEERMVDAASFPPEYWHWKHLWELYRKEHPEMIQPTVASAEGPLLSIVVPVYRPSLWYFRECVQSVIDQTYGSWELCLCDDGSDDPELTATMAGYAAADSRIKVSALERNGGISAATNGALANALGEFIVLIDHDDLLEPDALAQIAVVAGAEDVDIIYSDEDKLDELGRLHQPHFKPDWDPDLLLSYPYFGHVTAIRHEVLRRIGNFRSAFDGSQDYDVMLRSAEVARKIVHIPKVLYHWRVVAGSAAGDAEAKPWAYAASRRALEDAVTRRGIDGVVETGPFLGAYHLRRRISGSPTVSVVIPFRDQAAMTVACLESLDIDPGYEITEVVLIDNGSTEPETRELRRRLRDRAATRVLDYPGAFNWSAINNAAAATCTTDLLLFMNNDIEAESTGWLHALVEQCQRPEIGAVGARLLYPDGRLQHAGVVLGMEGIASHIFNGLPPGRLGYFGWDATVRSYSAVTAACMMVRREVFEALGGFDEDLPVAFNDIDFCIRLGRAGYRVLYTPHAVLTHYESVSRGLSGYTADFQRFLTHWGDLIREDDPYYNRNLSRFDPWCSFRAPGDDEKWLATMGSLQPDRPPTDSSDHDEEFEAQAS